MEKIESYRQFEEIIASLSHSDFEKLLATIWSKRTDTETVEIDAFNNNRQFDMIVTEVGSMAGQRILIIEIKKQRALISVGQIEQFYAKALDFQSDKDRVDKSNKTMGGNKDKAEILIWFIAPSGYTKEALIKAKELEIFCWDIQKIYELMSESIFEEYFNLSKAKDSELLEIKKKSKSENLILSLSRIEPGKNTWSKYQQIVYDIVSYLFCPPLESPNSELADFDRRNRRDIIMENSTYQGYWQIIREVYFGNYIVIDAKTMIKK